VGLAKDSPTTVRELRGMSKAAIKGLIKPQKAKTTAMML
jgi:hypothetical protein